MELAATPRPKASAVTPPTPPVIAAPTTGTQMQMPWAEPMAPFGNVLIARMKDRADLSQFQSMPRGAERRTAVFNALMEKANTSQVDAMAKLAELQKSGAV